MKMFLLLISALLGTHTAMSCTIIPETFCRSIEIHTNYLIAYGAVVAKDQDGLDLTLIEVLRGSESQSQIRIWDGTDFECNGLWDMSTNTIGEIGDTVVISLPKITEIENPWDVIGDYRRPDPYHYTSELHVENGTVHGLIAGDAIAPPEFNVLSLAYVTLRESILAFDDCSDIVTNTNNLIIQHTQLAPNPVSSVLSIQSNSSKIKKLALYNIQGVKVWDKSLAQNFNVQIDLHQFSSGIYILHIFKERGEFEAFKFIKS